MPTGFEKYKQKLDQERGVGFNPDLESQIKPRVPAGNDQQVNKDPVPAKEEKEQRRPGRPETDRKFSKSFNLDEASVQALKDLRYATNKSYTDLLIEGIKMLSERYLK